MLKSKFQISKQKFCHLSFVLCHSFVICALSFAIYARHASAQPISSSELINNAKQYDGRTVVYAGEVIGEVMVRGKFAWVNVNDGEAAIGIWVDKNLAKEINYTGSYKFKGDGIEIVGIFRRACPEHGGDLDIHAQGVRKISEGKQNIERLNLSKRNQTIILLGILCLIWILTRLRHK